MSSYFKECSLDVDVVNYKFIFGWNVSLCASVNYEFIFSKTPWNVKFGHRLDLGPFGHGPYPACD
jgi:hypothetical protein